MKQSSVILDELIKTLSQDDDDKQQRRQLNTEQDSKQNESPQPSRQRFVFGAQLTETLQGEIHFATDRYSKSNQIVIVKKANKSFVAYFRSNYDHSVHENIYDEIKILKYLTNQPDVHDGICRLIHNWEDDENILYAMQYCRTELFQFIAKEFSQNGIMYNYMQECNKKQRPQEPIDKFYAHQWLIKVRHIFRQLVHCVYWMHQKGVVHLDLSLENTMIYEIDVLWIKIIDFGVAKHDNNFISNNARIGRRCYSAPEVYERQQYDTRKADIWSLGVILFKMLIGVPPYKHPSTKDDAFNVIINGWLSQLLRYWERLNLVTNEALDCMERIFTLENDRITMEELIVHPWVAQDLSDVLIFGWIRNNVNQQIIPIELYGMIQDFYGML